MSDAAASSTVPLCATIHLTGSASKIFSLGVAIDLPQELADSAARNAGEVAPSASVRSD